MSAVKRLEEAYDYLEKQDGEAALTNLCNIVEALSGGGRRQYKDWLKRKMPIIATALIGTGQGYSNITFPVKTDNQNITSASPSCYELSEVIYHLFRCGLDHKCCVDQSEIFDTKGWSFERTPDGRTGLSFYKLAHGIFCAILTDLPSTTAFTKQMFLYGMPVSNFCGISENQMFRTIINSR